MAEPDPETDPQTDHQHQHRVLVASLLAIALVTGLVAMFAVWANRQALNTDNWTNTSSEVLANKDVQDAVGAYLVDELFTSVDVSAEIQQLLPPQAAALAGPASAEVRNLADKAAPKLLARPRVQTAWVAANETAHRQLLRIIDGGGTTVSTKNGEVALNLRSLVDELAATLGLQKQVDAARSKLQGGTGATIRGAAKQKLGVTLPPSTGRLVIMRSDQLSTIQDVAKAIRGLAVVLTVLSLGLFALAVWFAGGWRRIALRRVGWCFIGLGLLVLLGRRVVGNRVVDGLVAHPSNDDAAHAVWTIGTSLLYDIAVAMFAYGAILVLAAWLAGPTRAAVASRLALAPSLRYRRGAVYGVLAAVFLLVILWGPTPATRKPLGIILFAVLLTLGVEMLRRQVEGEFPDAHEGQTRERLRAWYAARRAGRSKPSRTEPSTGSSQRVGELERLVALHERGALTDGEFKSQKSLILGDP
jgi:hypothetical protein